MRPVGQPGSGVGGGIGPAAAAEQGLRRSVPVRCNARISGPLVTGLARPPLLLPETLPPEEELAMICLQ